MDDEKKYCFDSDSMTGGACYYTKDKAKCLDVVRFIEKEKYLKTI